MKKLPRFVRSALFFIAGATIPPLVLSFVPNSPVQWWWGIVAGVSVVISVIVFLGLFEWLIEGKDLFRD